MKRRSFFGALFAPVVAAVACNCPPKKDSNFVVSKIRVSSKPRALKAHYSLELQHDLRAIHGLDAEAELTRILSAEIQKEINKEVIRQMYIRPKRRFFGLLAA